MPADQIEPCNAPNPYPVNGRCIRPAGHADDPDPAIADHTNGFSTWTDEQLAQHAEQSGWVASLVGELDGDERHRVQRDAYRANLMDALVDMLNRSEREADARRLAAGL
jgi:hypothetical protein